MVSVQGSKYFSAKDTMGRRRRTTLRNKKQKGGEVAMTPELWGHHLYADIHHDFGNIGAEFYNFGGTGSVEYFQEKRVAIRERDVMSSFFDLESDETKKTLMREPIEFILPERTAQSDTKVQTPIVDIENFGIVYDAGTFITTTLGAKNVISFGNILDPASTTKDEASKPIFFKKEGDISFQFPLSEFGFDPVKAGTICIKNVTPTTAMVGLVLDGVERDAISLQPKEICSADTPKSIKDVSIDKCGIFTSIAKAKAANVGKSIEDIKPDHWFKIGKTLGDTLLVASTMSTIGGVANPFVQAPGQWVSYIDQSPVDAGPTKFMLKTGDTLNHARAVLKNIPSILERPASGSMVKRYEFVPSDTSQLVSGIAEKRYDTLKANLVSSITTGYSYLVTQLNSMIEGGKLKSVYASANVDFDDTPPRDDVLLRMATAINTIVGDINLLSARLIEQMAPIVITNDNYKDALNFSRCVTPNASMFIENKLKKEIRAKAFVQITTASIFGGISVPGLDIPYYNMLTRARYGQDPLNGEYNKVFKIKLNNFLNPPAGAGAGQIGGADSEGYNTSPWEHQKAKGKLRGGKKAEIEIKPEFAEVIIGNDNREIRVETTEFPMIKQFMIIYEDQSGDIVLPVLYAVKQHYESMEALLIEDTIVLERILEELQRLEVLDLYTVKTNPENKAAILVFNEFVYEMYIKLAESDPDRVARLRAIKSKMVEMTTAGADVGPGAAAAAASAAVGSLNVSTAQSEDESVYVATGFDSPIDNSGDNLDATLQRVPNSPASSESDRSVGMAGLLSPADSQQQSPQRPPPKRQAVQGEGDKPEPRGGLRRTYRKKPNARNSTARISRTSKHPGLRKRKGTRKSRGV